jgi:transcriptional regulator with GAF, ATPase, and Fis domain
MQLLKTYENMNSSPQMPDLLGNRVEALRALATLMIREVESIEKVVPSSDENFDDKDFCLQDEIQRYEADLIRSALVKAQGRQRRAARILGVKVTTLNAKIKKYDINWRVIGVESDFVS